MSTDSNKQLVKRYYEHVVSTGAVDEVPDFVAGEYTEVHDSVRSPIGIEGARAHITGVRDTYPDFVLTVEQQIAEGEWVVSRVTMRGTHPGAWIGMAPAVRRRQLSPRSRHNSASRALRR